MSARRSRARGDSLVLGIFTDSLSGTYFNEQVLRVGGESARLQFQCHVDGANYDTFALR